MKPNWTFDRPTEPGEYWLALRPEIRPEVYAELDVMPPPVMEASGLGADGVLDGFWWGDHDGFWWGDHSLEEGRCHSNDRQCTDRWCR
jgi:hypothetical protein